MEYGYYPGCSLTGSARKLDRDVRTIFRKMGHVLHEIPDWNCCGALEYGNRKELVDLSAENLTKAEGLCREIVAPCPACHRNLKEANREAEAGRRVTVLSPLDLFDTETIASLKVTRDLRGEIFTPYYGCVLLRPAETAIRNDRVMEEVITYYGGEVAGERMRDRCCGGGQFFANKGATEKLSTLILDQARGTVIVFCPLCHMALKTFSKNTRIVYFTELVLYLMGEKKAL
jgi:heterodisulfide reductase subunit B2